MHVTPLFINLHWLPIAARIKFKTLMFAYKTSSGSAPLYINSLLQTYVPLKLAFWKWTSHYCSSQRGTKSLSQTFSLTVPSWPTQSSSWVLRHLQESAKNTSLPSLFDPLTLALSSLILFFKKNLSPFRLAILFYSFTACFLKKKNLFVFYLFSFYLLNN